MCLDGIVSSHCATSAICEGWIFTKFVEIFKIFKLQDEEVMMQNGWIQVHQRNKLYQNCLVIQNNKDGSTNLPAL